MKKLFKLAYERVYDALPQRAKVAASELVFRIGNKPFVYHDSRVHPSEGLERGAVSFSIDFELAWAWQYARGVSHNCTEIALRERAHIPGIVARFEELNIPATWATVGHLFLEKCQRDKNGLAHADMRRPTHFENAYWQFTDGDWFQHDPCTDVSTNPAWYAPDLIGIILSSQVRHEVGCHSFSHAPLASMCTPEVAGDHVDACLHVMKQYGLTPVTWVFPGNLEGNFDVLARRGFKIVRAFPEPWAEVSLPVKLDDGMWRVHDSTPIDLEGSGWNFEERLARLKKYVSKAAETKLAAHIWFHPSLPRDQLEGLLFPLLRYCADQRDKGLIDIFTLEQLVQATESALRKEGRA